MSTVVNVAETWSLAESENGTSGRTALRVFTVLFDVPGSGLLVDARAATGVPQPGDVHPDDAYLSARSAQSRMISPVLVEVRVAYGTIKTIGFNVGVTIDGEDPLDMRPEIRWGSLESEEDVEVDAEGDPIVNANGDIITLKKKFNDPLLIVIKNFATIDASYMMTYMGEGGATNSDTFLGALPGQALLTKLEAHKQYVGTWEFWRVEFNVAFRQGLLWPSKAWYRRHADRGFRVRINAAGKLVRARIDPDNDATETGDVTPEPVLLDVGGYRVTDPVNTHWIETQVYPSLAFAPLEIL